MKRFFSIIMAVTLVISCLCACNKDAKKKTDALQVVTTIFPVYDWTKQIIRGNGQNVELTLLLDDGVDLHNYQPTVEDIMKISTCDIFIYVGGESDEWVDDALKEATNKDMKVINLMDVLGENVKEEEIIEGMQGEEEEVEEEEAEYDEHVWLSLKNATIFCEAITNSLKEVDEKNKDLYQKNSDDYQTELGNLDSEYESVVKEAKTHTLLFGDRFPFRYLVDDYGLDYYAAFVGCSAETEASFETITFLAKKVDELKLSYVLTIEKSDEKIAQTIIDNTKKKNQEILSMDSMQATTKKDVDKGANYLAVMKSNLNVLKEAIN